jgi:hypothetical protein
MPEELPEGERPEELPESEDDALERTLEPESPEIGQPVPGPTDGEDDDACPDLRPIPRRPTSPSTGLVTRWSAPRGQCDANCATWSSAVR